MSVLPWPVSPRTTSDRVSASRFRAVEIGDYAGRGRYMPRDVSALSPQLCRAIGKTIRLQFAGVARDNRPYAGQRLFRECPGSALVGGAWIPEQDLDFVD